MRRPGASQQFDRLFWEGEDKTFTLFSAAERMFVPMSMTEQHFNEKGRAGLFWF